MRPRGIIKNSKIILQPQIISVTYFTEYKTPTDSTDAQGTTLQSCWLLLRLLKDALLENLTSSSSSKGVLLCKFY